MSCPGSRVRNPSTIALLALAAVAGLLLGPAAHAATECFDGVCTGACSPDPPVALSTLVSAAQVPAGLPTSFIGWVDPNDGRDRRLIPTQQGTILVWDGGAGEILATPFLDLRSSMGGPVTSGGERGLLSMAADPDYARNGRFYVFYTSVGGAQGPGSLGDIVIERYQRSAGDPDTADPASAVTILVIGHPAGNHNGGTLAFGPDGFLYISTGDGGGSCDGNQGANGDGQRPDTISGKMLRIDVRGIDPGAGPPDDCGVPGEGGNYTVPSTNPFFGQEPACDEVWVLGLRNPFRFSFDRLLGDLYVGDVGQNKWEEINLKRASVAAPVNFGWVCREGCETGDNNESNCNVTNCPMDTGIPLVCEFPRMTGFWDPILCHHNDDWVSIMGGYRYRGTEVPSIAGDYVYSDAACGQIWKTTTLNPANPAAIDAECWASGFQGVFGFAEDHLGELYVVVGGAGGGNRIACIHNGAGCPWAGEGNTIFSDGFESGTTKRWTTTVE